MRIPRSTNEWRKLDESADRIANRYFRPTICVLGLVLAVALAWPVITHPVKIFESFVRVSQSIVDGQRDQALEDFDIDIPLPDTCSDERC